MMDNTKNHNHNVSNLYMHRGNVAATANSLYWSLQQYMDGQVAPHLSDFPHHYFQILRELIELQLA